MPFYFTEHLSGKEDSRMSFEKITFPEDSVFLVTGGAGFIGSNVAEAILKRDIRYAYWTICRPDTLRTSSLIWSIRILRLSRRISGIWTPA